jgi:hypothetical protein
MTELNNNNAKNIEENNRICNYNKMPDAIYVAMGYVTYLHLSHRSSPIDCYSIKLFALINFISTPLYIHNMMLTSIECEDIKENSDFIINIAAAVTITQIIPMILVAAKVYGPAVFFAFIGYNLISKDDQEYFSVNLREPMKYLRKNVKYYKEDFTRSVIEFAEKETIRKVTEAKEVSYITLKIAEETSNALSDFKNYLSYLFSTNEETSYQEVCVLGETE